MKKENSKKVVNNNIRSLLSQQNQSKYKLAAAIGASRSTVGHWIINDGSPAADFIPKIADFFNVPIEYLFQENNGTPSNTIPLTLDEENYEQKEENRDTAPELIAQDSNIIKPDGYTITLNKPVDGVETLVEIYISLTQERRKYVLSEACYQFHTQEEKKRQQ